MKEVAYGAFRADERGVHRTDAAPLVCCSCGLIRDETGSTPRFDRWVRQRTYRETHGVNPTEVALTHTYCPKCFTKGQDTMRQYFREIGTSP